MDTNQEQSQSVNGQSENGNYRVLALETRPQSLSQLVGQSSVRKVLGDLISTGRIPHALLFTGTRGTGKTSTARIFSKALCCINGPIEEPCQVCEHCVNITSSSHEDVMEIDGASNTGVDQIRELRESARFYPKSARYKVFIIDEVHMLSTGAFNALLKTLEEPPPRVIFVLATTEVNKVPLTVRSRCLILPFRKADVVTLSDYLGEVLKTRGLTADADALKLIAREGQGSFRDSLSLLEQTLPYAEASNLTSHSASQALGLQDADIARRIFKGICSNTPLDALAALDEANRAGLDLSRVLQDSAEIFRHSIVMKSLANKSTDNAFLFDELLESEQVEIANATESMSHLALSECFRLLQQSVNDVMRSQNQKPWAEIAVLDAIERSKWMSTEDLLEGLKGSVQPARNQQSSSSQPQTQPAAQRSSERSGANAAPALSQPAPAQQQETQAQVQSHASEPAPAPSAPVSSTTTQNENVDEQKLKDWTQAVVNKASFLGMKLRHIQFTEFNHKLVTLSECDENRIFNDISSEDYEILIGCLKDIGLESAQVSGFQVSKAAVSKKKTNGLEPRPTPVAPARLTQPASSAAISIAQHSNESTSVSNVEQEEALVRFENKKRELLKKPFFLKLAAHSNNLSVTNLAKMTIGRTKDTQEIEQNQ